MDIRGDYRMEDRFAQWSGSYAFGFKWEGMIERDGEDFILVHTTPDLVSRRFEERMFGKDDLRVVTADDVPDRPALNVKYVLRDKTRIRFFFDVTGFDVPLNDAPEAFPLVLPASADDSGVSAGFHYDSFVKSGSNDIVVEEQAIVAGPVEKEFSWTWAWQTRILKIATTLAESNRHEVKVKLFLSPRND